MNTICQRSTCNIDIGTIILSSIQSWISKKCHPVVAGVFLHHNLCRMSLLIWRISINQQWFKWIYITLQNSSNRINVIIHIMYNLMHIVLVVYLPICDQLKQDNKHQSHRYYRSCRNDQYSSNILSWCLYLGWIVIFCINFGRCFWLRKKNKVSNKSWHTEETQLF